MKASMIALRTLAVLVLVLLGASPAAAADAWTPYSNAKFGLSTSFPSTPRITEQTTPETDTQVAMETTIAMATPDESRAYSLQLTRGSRPPPDVNAVLDALPDAVADKMGMPIISRSRFDYQGFPALDTVMGPSPQGLYVRARYIVRGNDLIQILTVRQDEAPPADRFYTDFKLQP
jgi:hypothetical protein